MADLDFESLALLGDLPAPGQPGNPESPSPASPSPANGLPATVNADTLAALLGIQARTIAELARRGDAVKIATGKFDLTASVQAYIRAARGKAKGKTLEAERERLTKAQADLAESKAAEARGEMVPAAAVAATWSAAMADIRAALLAVPERAAARAGLDRAVVEILSAEIRETLEALADAN